VCVFYSKTYFIYFVTMPRRNVSIYETDDILVIEGKIKRNIECKQNVNIMISNVPVNIDCSSIETKTNKKELYYTDTHY